MLKKTLPIFKFFLFFLITVFTFSFFYSGSGINQKFQNKSVAWVDLSQNEPAVSVADLRMNQSQSKESLKKNYRSPAQATRYIAVPKEQGPVILNVNGHKKLKIKLLFHCSPWMYSKSSVTDIDSVIKSGEENCKNLATESTAVINYIYDSSQIPVFFVAYYDYQVGQLGWLAQANLLTPLSNAEIDSFTSDPPGNLAGVHYLNTNEDGTGNSTMPDIVYGDIRKIMTPFSKAGTPVVTTDPATCNPKYTSTCGDPNSIVVVPPGDAFWSNFDRRKSAVPNTAEFADAPCNPSVCASYIRGAFPLSTYVFTCGGANSCSTSVGCVVNCRCIHKLGDASLWGQSTYCNGVSGWPGDFYDPSNPKNRCGCKIVKKPLNTIEGWIINEKTFSSLNDSIIRFNSIAETYNWTRFAKKYNNIPGNGTAAKGEYLISLFVRTNSLELVNAVASAIPDPINKKVNVLDRIQKNLTTKEFSFSTHVEPLPPPSDFFMKYGIVVVQYPFNDTYKSFAHEIGHLLGGEHELTGDVITPEGQRRFRDKVAAYIHPSGAYGTIMQSGIVPSINAFSNPTFKTANGQPQGDANTDNRAQIIRTINYLAKRQLAFPTKKEEAAAVNLINEIVLEK